MYGQIVTWTKCYMNKVLYEQSVIWTKRYMNKAWNQSLLIGHFVDLVGELMSTNLHLDFKL